MRLAAALSAALLLAAGLAAAQSPALDASDARTLEALRRTGTDLSQPHTPLYFLSFPDAAAEKAARRTLEADGFRVMKAAIAQDGAHVLVLTRTMPLSTDNVRRASQQLAAVASKYGGRYAGWDAQPRR